MKSCTNRACKQSIPDQAVHCPFCGQTQITKKSLSTILLYVVGGLFLIIVAVLIGQVLWLRSLSTISLNANPSGDAGISATITMQPTTANDLTPVTPTTVPTLLVTNSDLLSPTSVSNTVAQISCAEISEVNIRKSPGYNNKNDAKDRVVKVPCGEYINILGGPSSADGLNWWNVSWNDYQGWMADHTGTGKVILIFPP